MKTLIINGSPRINGDSMALVGEMLKHLEGESTVVHAYHDGISPCMDCRYCWQNPGCSIKDGMQRVYGLLNEVDNVILASPVYFSELTGGLLCLASRLQTFYAARQFRHDESAALKQKQGALVLAAGGDTKDMHRAVSTAKIIFRQMNTTFIGSAAAAHTNDTPALQDADALQQARVLARMLNGEGL